MDMEPPSGPAAEPSVDEGAFWHTNMDLYYGYVPGEVVEVEHEPTKYWLARIEFSYKQLVLLKWLGNYGEEFWIDTSLVNSTATGLSNNTSCTSLVDDDTSFLKDYPQRPTKILIKPSLYNPAKDPYADVKTIEDLLAHELDSIAGDTFANQSTSNSINEPVSLALVKNKTKINYGQEDQDELEAALQNLTDEIDGAQNENEIQLPCPSVSFNFGTGKANKPDNHNEDLNLNKDSGFESDASNNHQLDRTTDISKSDKSIKANNSETKEINYSIKGQSHGCNHVTKQNEEQQGRNNDEARIEMCKKLQESAISKGRYMGIELPSNDQCEDEIYFLKPKQFFDIGGANQERVFVSGTLIEVCHSSETSDGLSPFHWFAYVIKNVGGRLTLRWFLCDEPKFKQGRLELKTCRSKFIQEEDTSLDNSNGVSQDDETNKQMIIDESKIPVKSLTFSVHFCDPKVHTISYAKQNGRSYKLPDVISKHICLTSNLKNDDSSGNLNQLAHLETTQSDYVFDPRRINLDKDRSLIDHILATVRNKAPNYLDLIYAPKDVQSKRDVLISCPKMTKLLRGHIRRELEPNVFEVISDSVLEGDTIRFIYPFDNSFAILPLSWADSNKDCLSIDPSRNTTPSFSDNKDDPKLGTIIDQQANNINAEDQESEQPVSDASSISCLVAARSKFPQVVGSFHKLPNLDDIKLPELKAKISNLDECDPKGWTSILRSRELEAPSFHCCIDSGLKESIESKFKVMDLLEVVHPSSDSTICSGRIRKVVYPLIWIQISSDSYTVLPFNSTNIYPAMWCETYQHPLVSFLPPRKRHIDSNSVGTSQSNDQKKRKKLKISEGHTVMTSDGLLDYDQIYVKETFDLGALEDKQSGIDYILNEKSMYIKIYFNHKCFTGPSLSKSKICTLPQYVGPGPMRLVMEEVVTKVISVAYVPPRILNDLSSKSFEDLLSLRNLKNTTPIEFKAKYQKRVHREDIPICLNPDDVALYCECLCEHLKCCYNLFGPNQYDGDDCPGHCRALTKSNKFMKRATYYRDKARAGEFLGNNSNSTENQASKKANSGSNRTTSTSRPRYAGRGSSESTSSSVSRSDQVVSRASSSSSGDDSPSNEDAKADCLHIVKEEDEQLDQTIVGAQEPQDNDENICNQGQTQMELEISQQQASTKSISSDNVDQRSILKSSEQPRETRAEGNISNSRSESAEDIQQGDEFQNIGGDNNELIANDPNEWSVEDVCRALDALGLSIFVRKMRSESIDGRALLLLDEATIEEHFQKQSHVDSASDELEKLCRFVEFAKVRLAS